MLNADSLLGDNTDGHGLITDLRKNLGLTVTNERILILGAGGATRGVIEPLLSLGPTELVIANRTQDRAVNLASLFVDLGAVRGCGFEDVGDEPFDLVINATAAGLTGSVPNVDGAVIAGHTVCYDMSYSKSATPFVTWAIEQGCARAHKGWGMLVEQAAEAFTLWRGVRPDTEPVLIALGTK
jgi:shikimate dehydrogenase